MSRDLGKIGWHYRVKKDGEYPAPCRADPDRLYQLFTDDVLTKNEKDGTYMIHTGIGLWGLVLKDDEVERVHSDQHLVLL